MAVFIASAQRSAGALLAVFVIGALYGCGTELARPHAFNIVVDLTAEGETVQIRRRVICDPRRDPQTGFLSWTRYPASLGARLKSKAAVIVVTPDICGPAATALVRGKNELAKRFVPLIAWINDADDPTKLEVYVSTEYSERSDARIRFDGIKVVAVDQTLLPESAPGEFGWLGESPGERRLRRNTRFFSGFYAKEIHENEWGKSSELGRRLRAIRSPMRVDGGKIDSFTQEKPVEDALIEMRRGHGVMQLSDVIPLFGDRVEVARRRAQSGYLALGWSPDEVRKDGTVMVPTIRLPGVTVKLDGQEVSVPFPLHSAEAVFDPATRSILLVHGTSIEIPANR